MFGYGRYCCKSPFASLIRKCLGGHIELEHVGSADSPLAFHCLYGDRHRQRCLGTKGTSRLGGPVGAASPRLAPGHRSVLVRTAVCHQVAHRVMDRRIGVNAMASDTQAEGERHQP